MKIKNHRLYLDDETQVPFRESPNNKGPFRGNNFPKYLVMHYTAGVNMESAVQWLTNPVAKASAHLVIGRNGQIVQLVPFDKIAYHAGVSNWEGLKGLNEHSIGIELENVGQLKKQNGKWMTWFHQSIPEDQVIIGQHRYQNFETGWQTFTIEQIDAVIEISALLIQTYNLLYLVGHDDISPYRKIDPGIAFPMENVRSKVMGREEGDLPIFETSTVLNIRVGPGQAYAKLTESPLPKNARVNVLQNDHLWALVDVLEGNTEPTGVVGWVHGGYLRRV